MALIIEALTKPRCKELLPELAKISEQTSGWGATEFLYDLPEKWTLSFTAWDRELVGYVILSRRWPDRVHIHQFMIKKSWQNKTVGSQIMEKLKEYNSGDLLTLKVEKYNERAINFYEKNGFLNEKSEGEYLCMVCPPRPENAAGRK